MPDVWVTAIGEFPDTKGKPLRWKLGTMVRIHEQDGTPPEEVVEQVQALGSSMADLLLHNIDVEYPDVLRGTPYHDEGTA